MQSFMEELFFDFKAEDREDYIQLSNEFYHSDSVLEKVDQKNFERGFDMIMKDSPFLRGLMIKDQGNNVGYAMLALSYSVEGGGMELWLEELYLRPKARGKGYAKAFFAFIDKEYRNTISRFRLEVAPEKKQLIDLYKRYGFEILPYVQMVRDPEKTT